jgi:hypothetical protein
MPFMKGKAPIRRTLKYLEAGKLMLKDKIRVFSINYNTFGDHHEGAKGFVFWTLPQLQYKNPNVQVVTFKNMTPSPFIQCYFGELFWKNCKAPDLKVDIFQTTARNFSSTSTAKATTTSSSIYSTSCANLKRL